MESTHLVLRFSSSALSAMRHTISSRTPEGAPNHCPVCGKALKIEPSTPPGDAPCPHCGQLLWFVRREAEDTVRVANMYVLRLGTHVEREALDEVCEELDLDARNGPRWTILDFQRVQSISSGAIGRLITLSKKTRYRRGRLSLRNIPSAVASLFALLRLEGTLEV